MKAIYITNAFRIWKLINKNYCIIKFDLGKQNLI